MSRFQRDEGRVAVHPDLMSRDDVIVRRGGGNLCFAEEAVCFTVLGCNDRTHHL